MVKALVFKGDKRPSKKRRRGDDGEGTLNKKSTGEVDVGNGGNGPEEGQEDDSWTSAESVRDISGPVMLVLPTESPVRCLACDANGKVFASEVENLVEGNPNTAEPHDVRQVWVSNRAAGTEGLSFKGHHGRYLGADKIGMLSASREAISAEESFTCAPMPDVPGAFALQTAREGWICVESVEDDTKEPKIRADADDTSFRTTLRIRMQARFKPTLKASKEEKASQKISRKELEEVVGRRLEDEEVRKLKRARREGNYHETILDVRVKGKHDKFAS